MSKEPASKSSSAVYVIGALAAAAFAVGIMADGGQTGLDLKPETVQTTRSTKPKGPAPKIVAVKAAHNFGKVKEGTAVEHTFKVRNEGKGQLVIEKASGS